MEVEVDELKCVGCGTCVMVAPELFAQSEDHGFVVLLQENPPPNQHDAARQAARRCPAHVITFEE